MINDPNYNMPKDAVIRLFDNPIPAGDPARSEAPEWAQELDEVVVWAHMGDNGKVSVKVNGEDIGGGGGISYYEVSFTPVPVTGENIETWYPSTFDYETIISDRLVCGESGGDGTPFLRDVVCPASIYIPSDLTVSSSSTGSFTYDAESNMLFINGTADIVFEVI